MTLKSAKHKITSKRQWPIRHVISSIVRESKQSNVASSRRYHKRKNCRNTEHFLVKTFNTISTKAFHQTCSPYVLIDTEIRDLKAKHSLLLNFVNTSDISLNTKLRAFSVTKESY